MKNFSTMSLVIDKLLDSINSYFIVFLSFQRHDISFIVIGVISALAHSFHLLVETLQIIGFLHILQLFLRLIEPKFLLINCSTLIIFDQFLLIRFLRSVKWINSQVDWCDRTIVNSFMTLGVYFGSFSSHSPITNFGARFLFHENTLTKQ